MPLPNLQSIVPSFDLTIPSNDQVVKFRPFLVKEEKLLLIALESNDDRTVLDSILQVVKACALTPLKIEDLANFDLEYLFLQLRSRSVSEIVELRYRCKNEIEYTQQDLDRFSRGGKGPRPDGETPSSGACGHVVKIDVNLDLVAVEKNPNHSKQIMLTDTMGINMRYPNFKVAKQILNKKDETGISEVLQTIAMCVDSVFDESNVYSNFNPEEIRVWIEQLTQKQFMKLSEFFDTMPKLAHTVVFECPRCGYKEDIRLEGLQSFFG